MELSPARELNLEGWQESEIIQISVFFEELFQNLKKRCPRCNFLWFFCQKASKGVAKGSQIPQKSSKNGVQNSLGFPLAARSLPEGVQGSKRWPKVIENRRFCDRFYLEFQWRIVLKMLIPGSC